MCNILFPGLKQTGIPIMEAEALVAMEAGIPGVAAVEVLLEEPDRIQQIRQGR